MHVVSNYVSSVTDTVERISWKNIVDEYRGSSSRFRQRGLSSRLHLHSLHHGCTSSSSSTDLAAPLLAAPLLCGLRYTHKLKSRLSILQEGRLNRIQCLQIGLFPVNQYYNCGMPKTGRLSQNFTTSYHSEQELSPPPSPLPTEQPEYPFQSEQQPVAAATQALEEHSFQGTLTPTEQTFPLTLDPNQTGASAWAWNQPKEDEDISLYHLVPFTKEGKRRPIQHQYSAILEARPVPRKSPLEQPTKYHLAYNPFQYRLIWTNPDTVRSKELVIVVPVLKKWQIIPATPAETHFPPHLFEEFLHNLRGGKWHNYLDLARDTEPKHPLQSPTTQWLEKGYNKELGSPQIRFSWWALRVSLPPQEYKRLFDNTFNPQHQQTSPINQGSSRPHKQAKLTNQP